jgi:UDP-N-acetyl-D-mannosaminuronate dehydrogenase
MTERESTETMSVVLGLGEVGRPLLEVLGRAHRVEGIDVPPRDVGGRVDFMHVCYPAEIADFVGTTEGYVRRYAPDVVIIHSTVPVGMTARVQERVAAPVVHSPVRGKHVRMVSELTRYVKFVGTADDAVAARVERYFQAAGMRTKRLSSPDATELAKLAETTYLGLLIAFAQDVDRMARETGVDYDELASFYEEIEYLPQVRFFPGVIGGHCVIPNIKLLRQQFDSRLLEAIEWSNDLRKATASELPRSEHRDPPATGPLAGHFQRVGEA